ncbi:MAG: SDR family oxidoreductase [Archangiaceae bacterium]|nr:SDR family oxidoreductase [Archangiaceae bacterium]
MKTILVTGASDGIGKQTALELARLGHTVLVHARSEQKAAAAVAELSKAQPGHYQPFFAELSKPREVDQLADRMLAAHPTLDVLLNNAGVFMKERQLTAEGFELSMAVNHFSHFVLTHRLLPALKAAPQGRVVHVASMAHGRGHLDLNDLTFERGFEGYGAYATSKLANVLFSNALARRLHGTAVTSNALHPGVIHTKLLTHGFGGGGAALESGARTSVFCATANALEKVSGAYFSDARQTEPSREARDAKLAEDFYALSCKLTGVTPLPA